MSREPFDCPDYIPYPTMESGLKDSESVVTKEREIAVYECFDSPQFLINGLDTQFNLTCLKTGYPVPLIWPTCVDPSVTTTTMTPPIPLPPCQCIGDEG